MADQLTLRGYRVAVAEFEREFRASVEEHLRLYRGYRGNVAEFEREFRASVKEHVLLVLAGSSQSRAARLQGLRAAGKRAVREAAGPAGHGEVPGPARSR